MDDLTGETLGQYRIIEKIGRGGIADVHKVIRPREDTGGKEKDGYCQNT